MAKIDVLIDQQQDLTIFNVDGDLTATEIIEHSLAACNNHPTKKFLWDVTKGTVSSIGSNELRYIATQMQTCAEKRAGGQTAMVGSFDIDYGLARQYEAFARINGLPIEYATFRTVEEAKTWLGIV